MPNGEHHPNLVAQLAHTLHRDRRKELEDQIEASDLPFDVNARLQLYANERMLALSHLVETLGEPEDEDELYPLICGLWLELRMEWTRYNHVLNYQILRGGDCDPEIVARGCLCSAILGWLEGCLKPIDQQFLTDLASDPMAAGSQSAERLRQLLAYQTVSADALDQALDDAERPLRAAPTLDTESYRRNIEALRDSAADAKRVPTDLVWPQIERPLQEHLDASAWHVRIQREPEASRVDPRWVSHITDRLRDLLPWVLAYDMESSVEARRAAGKPSHLTVTVGWQPDGHDALRLILQTTGTGALADAPPQGGVHVQKGPQGSTITLSLARQAASLAS